MISETVGCREAALSGRLTYLNTGSGTAAIKVYNGTRPDTAADAPTGDMLVSIPLNNTTGSVAGGSLTLSPSGAGMIAVTGTVAGGTEATWVRVVNRNGDTAFDMDAGLAGSGKECILSDVDLYAGGLLSVLSAVLG